jgi:hypothetical protein
MLYMFLLYHDPQVPPPSDVMERHFAVLEKAHQADAYIASEAIGGTASATTVRVRDNAASITDGPYSETKEVMGGFYILDCRDLDEALEYAALIPDAQNGAVEVRPVYFVPDWPYVVAPDRTRQPMEL